jgi:hypothetical protein
MSFNAKDKVFLFSHKYEFLHKIDLLKKNKNAQSMLNESAAMFVTPNHMLSNIYRVILHTLRKQGF